MKTNNERKVGRRNWIAGALFGALLATVFGAYAATTFKKMVAGQAATAADVNQAHQDLATAIDALEAKVSMQGIQISTQTAQIMTLTADVAKLSSNPDCPPGYAKDMTSPASITVCKYGKHEMVKVGSFWIDRYEASLVDATTWNGGTCDGLGTQYGAGTTDDYPTTFPDSGNWTTAGKVYACSKSGVVPSGMMTWFQAEQACHLAGKRLCTNGEWQAATAGTSDPGKYDGSAGGSCHTGGTAPRKTGLAGSVLGASASCMSSWGAEDMIGNLWEWVDLWGQAGKSWMTGDGEAASPWPLTGGYGDGGDKTWNLNGRAANPSWINGSPAAALRGGGWGTGTGAGVFAMALHYGPSYWYTDVGARCCRQ